MSASTDCPDLARWPALLAAALPADQREHFERHLETCPACQERLDQADECRDELVRLARRVGDPTATPRDAALSQVVERLHGVKSPPAAADQEPTDLYFLGPSERPGVLGTLGDYEVLEVVGQGGMGVVLKAFEPTLNRFVAIKVMAAAVAGSATARRRFTREARAAAAVCHDHVVAVHGVHEVEGLPYLVMQYVAGESLQDRIDRAGPLDVDEVIRIGLQTASGLAAAHAQGLIHRDIKPANLLLENGLARVKISDFGLARMADDVGLTQMGVVAGTPEYMAPEQARGEAVDHRADLYSLGAVLYACCTGRPPFRGTATLALLRQVSEQEPAPVRSLNPDVPAWLEELILRLLAKDPARRFQSAAEVAALLEGYLAHLRQPTTVPAPELPVPPPGHRTDPPAGTPWWWLRPALLALAILAALGLGMGWWLVGGPGTAQVPPVPPADDIDQGIWTLAFSPDGQRLTTGGGIHTLPGQYQIWDVATGKALVTRRADPGVRSVAYSPDGKVLATGHWDGDIKLRDPDTGEVRAILTGHDNCANGLAFSDDGALLASAGLDGTVRIWDVTARRERQMLLGHRKMVYSVAFFHNGHAVVSGGQDGTARIWDLDTGKERFVLPGHGTQIEPVAVSPDDKLVVSGGWDGVIQFWDPTTGRETATLEQGGGVMSLAFSPDGKSLASGGVGGRVHIWDVASHQELLSIPQHLRGARGLAFSPDGKLLASGGEDAVAHLWDVAAGKNVATLVAAGAVPSADLDDRAAREAEAKSRAAWLAATAILAVVIVLSFLGVALVVRHRRRAPAGSERAGSEAASRYVSFPCPGCGKGLKARRAEAAGKRAKCPHCGQGVLVPGDEGSPPAGTPAGPQETENSR